MGVGPSVDVSTLAGTVPLGSTGAAGIAAGAVNTSGTPATGTGAADKGGTNGGGTASGDGAVPASNGDTKQVIVPTAATRVFSYPVSVIFDAAGNLIVSDSAAHCIRHVSIRGEVTLLAGQPGKAGYADGKGTAAQFDRPDQLCLDLQGRILCCDKNNHRIRMITDSGEVTTVAGTGEKGFADGTTANCKFDSPCGIAVDWKHRIVVSDTGNHRIRRITPADGKVMTIAGNGEAGFANGTNLRESKFHHPKGLCFDRAGRLLVADSENERVRRIGDGKIITLVGTGTRGFAEGPALESKLNHPVSVVCDRSGRLIICDSLNHRMRLYDNGQVSTLCGSGQPGATDASMGNGMLAQFRMPMCVIGDEYGHLIVADFGNHLIRVVSIDGSQPLKLHPRVLTAVPGSAPPPAAAANAKQEAIPPPPPPDKSPQLAPVVPAVATATATAAAAAAAAVSPSVPPPPPPASPPPMLIVGTSSPPPATNAVPTQGPATTAAVTKSTHTVSSGAAGAAPAIASPTAIKALAKLAVQAASTTGVPLSGRDRTKKGDEPAAPPAAVSPAPTTIATPAGPATTQTTTQAAATAPPAAPVSSTAKKANPNPLALAAVTAVAVNATARAIGIAMGSPPKSGVTSPTAAATAASAAIAAAYKPVVVSTTAAAAVPQRTAIGFAPRPVVEQTPPPPATSEPVAVVAPSAAATPAKYDHKRHPQRTGTVNIDPITGEAVPVPVIAAGTTPGTTPASTTPPKADPTPATVPAVAATTGTKDAPNRAAPQAPKIPASIVNLFLHPGAGGAAGSTAGSTGAGAGKSGGSPRTEGPTPTVVIGVTPPAITSVVTSKPSPSPDSVAGFTFTVTPVATPQRAVTVNMNGPPLPPTPPVQPTQPATATPLPNINTTKGSGNKTSGTTGNTPALLGVASPSAPKRAVTQMHSAAVDTNPALGSSGSPAVTNGTVTNNSPSGHHKQSLSLGDVSLPPLPTNLPALPLSNNPLSPRAGDLPAIPTTAGGKPVPGAPPRTRASAIAASLLAKDPNAANSTTPAPAPKSLLPASVIATHRRGDSSESDDTLSGGEGSGTRRPKAGAGAAKRPAPITPDATKMFQPPPGGTNPSPALASGTATPVASLVSPTAASAASKPPAFSAGVASAIVTAQPVVIPPVSTWLPGTVLLWLKQNHYAPQFVAFIEKDPLANAISGSILLALDEQMLLDCGVDNKLHRIKLLHGVATLKKQQSASSATAATIETPPGTPPPPPNKDDTDAPLPTAAAAATATTPAVATANVVPSLTPASPDRQSVPPPPPPLPEDSVAPLPAARPLASPPAEAAKPVERPSVLPFSLLQKLNSMPDDPPAARKPVAGGKPKREGTYAGTSVSAAAAAAGKERDAAKPGVARIAEDSTPAPGTTASSNGLATTNDPATAAAAAAAGKDVVLTDEQTKQMQQRRAFHAHSPLSPDEERRLTPMLPLGSKLDRANFDQFFSVLRSFDRTKWQWVLEAHLYLVATMNGNVSELILHHWHVWLFPLMQRQNERQQLMDKEAERSLLSLVTLLISRVHFQKFMGETSVTGKDGAPAGDGKDGKEGAVAAAVAAREKADADKDRTGDGTMAQWLTNMVNHIAGFVWDEGSSRVVRMILLSFFNLVHAAALKNNLWRNNVTHPAWKNLFSALTVVEDFVFFRPLGGSSSSDRTSNSSSSKKGKVKMGLHINHKGCLDRQLVGVISSILKALPIEKLRVMDSASHVYAFAHHADGSEVDIPKLQKSYQRAGQEAAAFFAGLNAYMDATHDLANKMTAGGIPGGSSASGLSGASGDKPGGAAAGSGPSGAEGATGAGDSKANKEQNTFASAQNALLKLCTGRKRFASGLFSSKGNTELKQMFDGVETEIQRKKNSKIFQPAVSFASLQDRKGSRLMSMANFEDPDELTRDDVTKLKEQCVGEPLGQGSFGRVYRVQLFGMTWACKIVPFAIMQGNNFRSEIRVHRKLRARRCVLFRGAYTKPPNLFILTEFVGRGDTLQDRVNAEYKPAATTATPAPATAAGAAVGGDKKSSGGKTAAAATLTAAAAAANKDAPPPPPPPDEDDDAKGVAPPPAAGATTTATAAATTAAGTTAAAATGDAKIATATGGAAKAGAAPGPNVLTLAQKLRIALQIVEGLNELHHQNPPVVHRDLKPTNVLLDKQCNVKLCDFGFSHHSAHHGGSNQAGGFSPLVAVTVDGEDNDHIESGNTPGGGGGGAGGNPPPGAAGTGGAAANKAGTPLYKAPEAWDSDPDRSVGTASDIYSFGILLHELFCGRLPWAGKKLEQISYIHLYKKTPPPVDPELIKEHARIAQIIESCTRPDDRKRPSSEQLLAMVRSLYTVYQIPNDDD